MERHGMPLLLRSAEELLISQSSAWSLRTAQEVTDRAMSSAGMTPGDAAFRSLVRAMYRVGHALEQCDGLAKAQPWDIDSLRTRVDVAVAGWTGSDERKAFVDDLSSHLRNREPFRKRILDWTPEINRFLRKTATRDFFPDLEAKLAFARLLDDLVERRREALVAFVETSLDVERRAVAGALAEEIGTEGPGTAAQRGKPAIAIDPTVADRLGVDEQEAISVVTALAAPAARPAFAEWIRSLPPPARKAVLRRASMLATEPSVHRLWVKTIIGSKRPGLRELRIVAGGIHHRILFTGGAGERPLILSFGLRRDLQELIAEAGATG